MTFSVLGYFVHLFEGRCSDTASSATALARWNILPSIPTAHCERRVAVGSAVKDFYAHFNPKYDVYQPSHKKDWLTAKRIAMVLSKRVMFDAYVAFANELNAAIEQADDPEDLEWQKIVQSTVIDPISTYLYTGVQEWIAEGIRIAYAKHIIAHWHRRTAWKFLKGSVQSSLRKYSRDGMLSFGSVCWTEARGNSLFIAAYTTLRVIKHPWTHRDFYMQTSVDKWDKLSYFCRSSACEVICMGLRIVLSGVGCGVGVGLGHRLWLSFGGKPGVQRWQPEDGKEKTVPSAIFLSWALGYNVADSLLQALLRPHLEIYLGLAPSLDDQDEEGDDVDDAPAAG